MTIIQIILKDSTIIGLGDDGLLYYWNTNLATPVWSEYKL